MAKTDPAAKKSAGNAKKAGKTAKAKPDKPELVDEDAKGNKTLPGMEYVVIRPIINAVKQIENISKPAFSQARDKLVRDKQTLSDVCHKNISHFTRSENGDGAVTFTYRGGGVEVVMKQTEEQITAKLIEDESVVTTKL